MAASGSGAPSAPFFQPHSHLTLGETEEAGRANMNVSICWLWKLAC